MGIMSWFTRSNKEGALELIEAGLRRMQKVEMFDGDPMHSAKRVMDHAATRIDLSTKKDLHPAVLAATCLVIFVLEWRRPREERLPYANVALALIQSANTHPSTRLSAADRALSAGALEELEKFIDAHPINLNTGNASSPDSDHTKIIIPINDAPTSIACIKAEHEYLIARYGVNGQWKFESQSHVEENGRFYDVMEISIRGQGKKAIWFDITVSKTLWTDEGNLGVWAVETGVSP